MIVGHGPVVARLEAELPPVTLLFGPSSVGKWTLTRHLAEHHRIAMADRSVHPDGLTADGVRSIRAFVATAPAGRLKLVTARLDGSSPQALNGLLKTLEEPPPKARFLFTAALPVLPTITSRAQVFRMGLLTTDQITQILVNQGTPLPRAQDIAPHGRGRVRVAQFAGRRGDAARTTVTTLARAVATGDRQLFDRAFTGFDDDTWDLLHVWLTEAISGQWNLFGPADACGLDQDRSRLYSMLLALSALPRARRRLAVRVALEPFLASA